MTLGTSLILIVILVLLIQGIKFISRKKKWRLVAWIAGLLFLLAIIITSCVWGWYQYKNRLQPINKLGSVALGMNPVDVTLAIGKPSQEILPDNFDNKRTYIYTGYTEYYIRFSGSNEKPSDVADVICSDGIYIKVFGLSKYDSEEKVLKKLGAPTSQSIRSDGLVKAISYGKWNVSFEIEKGIISRVCISSDGEIKFINEYNSNTLESNVLNLKDSPLTTTNTNPIITGTYNGDYGVQIEISRDNKIVLSDVSDHGGMVELSSYGSTSGLFSYKIPIQLDKGTYVVKVFVFHNIYNDEGYSGNSEPVLVNSGILTIE